METLKEKFEAECRNISTGCIYDVDYWLLAENCEKIAIQSQIELLVELSNKNIISFASVEDVIIELESQLNKE